MIYLPEPFKEGFVEFSELPFGLLVIHQAFLIESLNFIIPTDQEIGSQDLLVHEFFHEGGSVLGHLLVVFFDEVEDDSLHEVLDADFTLFLNQSDEQVLVFGPVLENASFGGRWEDTAKGDEVQPIRC